MSIEWKILDLLTTVAFTANRTSAAIMTSQYTTIGVQVIWASLTGTLDATFTLEGSIDGTNFSSVMTPINISTASGNDCVSLSDYPFPFIRLVCTKNNVTGGNISAKISFKEE